MSEVAWALLLLVAYIIYCIYWGIEGVFKAKTSEQYAIAGRKIPTSTFILAVTDTCFGWGQRCIYDLTCHR